MYSKMARRAAWCETKDCFTSSSCSSVAKKRVARLMHEEGLVARPRRRFVVTTDSAHDEPVARNWLRRCFDVEALATLGGTNHVWASDISVPQSSSIGDER